MKILRKRPMHLCKNFGKLTKKLYARMLTYPMSTLGVLRMLMHLSSDHVTLPLRKFHSHEFPPPAIAQASGKLTLGFAPNFL